jgi:hypothetical protein
MYGVLRRGGVAPVATAEEHVLAVDHELRSGGRDGDLHAAHRIRGGRGGRRGRGGDTGGAGVVLCDGLGRIEIAISAGGNRSQQTSFDASPESNRSV